MWTPLAVNELVIPASSDVSVCFDAISSKLEHSGCFFVPPYSVRLLPSYLMPSSGTQDWLLNDLGGSNLPGMSETGFLILLKTATSGCVCD